MVLLVIVLIVVDDVGMRVVLDLLEDLDFPFKLLDGLGIGEEDGLDADDFASGLFDLFEHRVPGRPMNDLLILIII